MREDELLEQASSLKLLNNKEFLNKKRIDKDIPFSGLSYIDGCKGKKSVLKL